MTGTWLSIEVTLLRGHREKFWPPPGRVLAVGPTHTFAQLGEEIDRAFGRWDLGHLREVTLADGTVITDPETADELELDVDELPVEPVKIGPDIAVARVVEHVEVGDAFRYVFDFGDQWTHRCTVTGVLEAPDLPVPRPRAPLALFGWGALPDQYGRRWADDDGESPVPAQPADPDPMLVRGWPKEQPARRVDLDELRSPARSGDVEGVIAAVEGRDFSELLQHVGAAWQVVVAADPARAAATTAKIVMQLRARGLPGDEILAQDLLAMRHGTPGLAGPAGGPGGSRLPVDLDELSEQLEGSEDEQAGLLDLVTGEVLPGFLTDPFTVGEDASVDVEEDPDRWLALDRLGSRAGWQDMADFAATVTVAGVRDQLERAIEGRGAFRRFRDAVHRQGLAGEWHAFSAERSMGRAREWLADNDIRVAPPGPPAS